MIPIFMRAAATAVVACMSFSSAFAQPDKRSVLLLDKRWFLYTMPDFQLWPPEPRISGDQIKRLHCPGPGEHWQPVQLPDDYVVRGEISPEPNASLVAAGAVCPLGGRECEVPRGSLPEGRPGTLNRLGRTPYGGHGYLPLYPAWYQRKIVIPASSKGKSVWLDFGGVYRDAIVFVNGQFIDQHASGYTAFRLNITPVVRYGEENTIAVFVDPRWFEGWWYEGGGIYRHVRLVITNALQVAPWGTFVDARVPGPILYGSPAGDRAAAQLTVQTTVRNDQPTGQNFTLLSQVIDPAGNVVASTATDEQLPSGQEATFKQHLALRNALLWSLDHPNLYRLRTTIRSRDTEVDQTLTAFGIRAIRFDPERGFFLNDHHVEIHGVANHQDFPGVGIGAPDNLWSWRIQKLKAMGANAYRTAHNPVGEEFYEATDRMGMLVMDENRHLGDTYFPKAAETTPYSDLSDLKAMVLQHRNHPSIVMWSMCNEEGLGRTPYGAKMFAAMKAAARKIDPTRPTTAAMNGGFTKDGFISVEDLLGMNYYSSEFAKVHAEFPGLMIFGSEDTNAKSSRGTRETSLATGLCSAYGDGPSPDTPVGQPWRSWVPVVENPFVAGQFIWTGFDYRGEPNPFSWPAVTSQTGAMDLCGFPKPVYYYWKAEWEQERSVYAFPDWNFPKSMVGQSVRVRIFSNCDRVQLSLNGKSLGVQQMPHHRYLDWNVAYAPGSLTAIGYNHGREAARYTVQTAGAPAALRLIPDIHRLPADGEAIAPIQVQVVDAQRRIVPDAENLIEFSVSGAGALAGVANGNPASHDAKVAQRKAFRGLCMVLVRAADRPGAIIVQAQAHALRPARIMLATVAGPEGRGR